MRVVLTEIGNASPGDEAITLAAARRLTEAGCDITVAYRVSLAGAFARAGIRARHVHAPLGRVGPHHASVPALLAAAEAAQPTVVAELERHVAESRLVCIAPGGKFADGFDNSLKLVTAALALRNGVPVMVLHQSVGPLQNDNERSLVRDVFRAASLVVARDRHTHGFLAGMGLAGERLVHGSDAALAEEYPPPDASPFDVGINLRWSAHGHSTAEGLMHLLRLYRAIAPDGKVLLYSTTTALPPQVISVAADFGCEPQSCWCTYPDYLRLVGSCRVNVTDSFHGAIFSLQADVPAICLQPDMRTWKLQGLAENAGWPSRIFPGLSTEAGARDIIDEIRVMNGSIERRAEAIGRQQAIVRAGRERAESAWRAVLRSVERIRSSGGAASG